MSKGFALAILTVPVLLICSCATNGASVVLPWRRLVLVEYSAPDWVAERFMDRVRHAGSFEIEGPAEDPIPLASLGEGDVGPAASEFRSRWPADVYVSLSASFDSGFYHPIRSEGDYGWINCDLRVAMRDARTGRLLANFVASGYGDYRDTPDVFESPGRIGRVIRGLGGPPPSEAEETAGQEAADAAVRELVPRLREALLRQQGRL